MLDTVCARHIALVDGDQKCLSSLHFGKKPNKLKM